MYKGWFIVAMKQHYRKCVDIFSGPNIDRDDDASENVRKTVSFRVLKNYHQFDRRIEIVYSGFRAFRDLVAL